MTFVERTRLLAFGVFGWAAGTFSAAAHLGTLVDAVSPVQAGIGAGLAVVALLPGRMARFS